MKKLLSFTIVIALGLVGTISAAGVSDLKLSYENQTTVATIVIDGQVRFTHETVEAKEGKPFRVVVDVLSVVHELPQKDFLSLPKCAVSSIRTSQYSVKPEQVVRLVFDMSKETVYRVDSDAHTIKLYFADKNNSSFTTWTAGKPSSTVKKKAPAAVVSKAPAKPKPATTVASINKSIESDRQVSLQSETTAKKSTDKASAKPKTSATASTPKINKSSVKTASKIEVPFGPEFASASPFEASDKAPVKAETKAAVEPNKVKPKAQPVSKAVSVDSQKAKESTPPVKTKTVAKVKPSSKTSDPAKPKAKPVVVSKAKVLATVAKPAASDKMSSAQPKASVKAEQKSKVSASKKAQSKSLAAAPVKKPAPAKIKPVTKPVVKKPVKKTLASAPAKSSKTAAKVTSKAKSKKQSSKMAKKPADKKSTSRFRRSASGSSKIKGTLVAQFPKRLVIKYKGRSRDPFETLIDETRVDNNPVERRAPNVEGLKLVGIIEAETGENRALFEDKNSFGYILKGGDKVQKGYVLRVEEDRVYFQIFEYGWSRTVALNIEDN